MNSLDKTGKVSPLRQCKVKVGRERSCECDTAATHHTTNEFDRLTGVQDNLDIQVEGSTSVCSTMGTLYRRRYGRNIRHEQCLDDESSISGPRLPETRTMKGPKAKVE